MANSLINLYPLFLKQDAGTRIVMPGSGAQVMQGAINVQVLPQQLTSKLPGIVVAKISGAATVVKLSGGQKATLNLSPITARICSDG